MEAQSTNTVAVTTVAKISTNDLAAFLVAFERTKAPVEQRAHPLADPIFCARGLWERINALGDTLPAGSLNDAKIDMIENLAVLAEELAETNRIRVALQVHAAAVALCSEIEGSERLRTALEDERQQVADAREQLYSTTEAHNALVAELASTDKV